MVQCVTHQRCWHPPGEQKGLPFGGCSLAASQQEQSSRTKVSASSSAPPALPPSTAARSSRRPLPAEPRLWSAASSQGPSSAACEASRGTACQHRPEVSASQQLFGQLAWQHCLHRSFNAGAPMLIEMSAEKGWEWRLLSFYGCSRTRGRVLSSREAGQPAVGCGDKWEA